MALERRITQTSHPTVLKQRAWEAASQCSVDCSYRNGFLVVVVVAFRYSYCF